MKIEHTAYQVEDPAAAARWYVDHLGLTVKRSQSVSPFGCFLADDGDAVMLEFYRQPHLPVPDYRSVDPYAGLVGCALNGAWTITVTDLWGSDNGFIFSWGVNFDPAIVEDCSSWPVE